MHKQLFIVVAVLLLQSVYSQDKTLGMTSPIHEKYVGKIVFTGDEKNIEKQKENEAGFKTEFNLGDPIYFRAYLKDAMLNTLRPLAKASSQTVFDRDSRFILKVYIDGKYLDSLFSARLSEDEFSNNAKTTWTTFRGALKSADNSVYIGTYMFKELLTKYERLLASGKHKLKMEVYPSYEPVGVPDKPVEGPLMASGEITLNITGSAIDKNDPNVCMPMSKMKDAEFEKSIYTGYTNAYKKTALSVKITSPQWDIVQSKYTGIATQRTVDVFIGYKEGSKCYKRAYLVIQKYNGHEYVKDIIFETNMQNPEREINCKCLETK